MILHRLSVKSWRNILNEVSLGPFSEEINVIHAPNGTGKSTLFEALQRGVFDSHNVTGRAIEDIKPWGRELAPRVTIEFSHGDTTYRLTKQFLSQPFVRLERKEGAAFKPFKEGRQADEFVRGLFSDQSPGRGLSKLEHHGLCQVLWAPQGGLELSNLASSVVANVRDALGVQVAGTIGGPIEREIENRYLAIFTKTGKLKSGKNAPSLVHIKRELEQLRQQRQEVLERYNAFQEASRKVEDMRATRQQAVRDTLLLKEKVIKAREQLKEFEQLKKDLDEAQNRVKAAQAQYQALKDKIQQVANTQKEIADISQAISQLKNKIVAAEKEVELRKQEVVQKRSRVEDLEQEKEKIARLWERLDLAQQLRQSEKQLSALRQRLEEIEQCTAELEKAKQKRVELVAPSREILQEVRDVIRMRDEARTKIESSLVRLEIVPRQPMDLEVIKGEKTECQHAHAGRPVEVSGAPEVVVELPGVARLRAWGPIGDIEEQRQILADATKRLTELTRPYGTENPDRLQALLDRAEEIEKEVGRVEDRLAMLVEGDDIDQLRAGIARNEAIVKGVLDKIPEWHEVPPDVDQLQGEYEDTKRCHDEQIEEARTDLAQAQNNLGTAQFDLQTLRARLEEKQAGYERAQIRLAELTQDGKSDVQRKQELNQLALEWDAARAAIQKIEEQLKQFQGDPAQELEVLNRQLEVAEKTEQEARDKEKTTEGEVAQLSREGLYTKLVACEERIASLERRVALEERRVAAIRLLHDTVEKSRSEMTASVVEPLERAATRLLERITGPRVGHVKLDDTLAPTFIQPVEVQEPVTIENLSGGETEQLHFVCRLALADVLAKEERQLLVLDDVLTATDTGRFARILRILEEIKQKLQIIILTCHPERYGGMRDVEFYDLEALTQRVGESA